MPDEQPKRPTPDQMAKAACARPQMTMLSDGRSGLTALERLNLSGTGVTEDGVARLREALPKCYIER